MSILLTRKNKEIISRLWDVWDTKDFRQLDELVTANHVLHDTVIPNTLLGVSGYREFIEIYTSLMPDLQFEVKEMVAEGDVVCTRWNGQGTQTGEALGLSPTNDFVEGTGISWQRLKNEKVVETWIERDGLGIVRHAETWHFKSIGD